MEKTGEIIDPILIFRSRMLIDSLYLTKRQICAPPPTLHPPIESETWRNISIFCMLGHLLGQTDYIHLTVFDLEFGFLMLYFIF